MALRTGHGHCAGVHRVEVLPVDELPEGLPVRSRNAKPCRGTAQGGSPEAREAGRRGGGRKAGTAVLAAGIDLAKGVR